MDNWKLYLIGGVVALVLLYLFVKYVLPVIIRFILEILKKLPFSIPFIILNYFFIKKDIVYIIAVGFCVIWGVYRFFKPKRPKWLEDIINDDSYSEEPQFEHGPEFVYVLNTRTKAIHRRYANSVDTISDKHQMYITAEQAEELINKDDRYHYVDD